jgi:hypothetical protein
MTECAVCSRDEDVDYIFNDLFVCEFCYEELQNNKEKLIADFLAEVEYEAYILLCNERAGL